MRLQSQLSRTDQQRTSRDFTTRYYLSLETTAGQGTTIGYRFEELADIIRLVDDKERIAVCVDTCHIFAAGYDISTENGYLETFEAFEALIGLDRLVLFHLNDSKRELGSRVDRHEHIGRGEIGEVAFEMIMSDERFVDVPKVIETPKAQIYMRMWKTFPFFAVLYLTRSRSRQKIIHCQNNKEQERV